MKISFITFKEVYEKILKYCKAPFNILTDFWQIENNEEDQNRSQEFVVYEDRSLEVNIGQAALGYLKQRLSSDITLIDNEELKKLILPSWLHFNDFCINCMKLKLWILETNFKDPMHAVRQILKVSREKLNWKDVREQLSSAMSGTYGLSFQMSADEYCLLINEDANKDDLKILHEFSHYVQKVTGSFVINGKLSKRLRRNLESIGIPKEIAFYFTVPEEFWINIYVDLFGELQKIYWLALKSHMSWKDFIDSEVNSLRNDVANWRKSSIVILWMKILEVQPVHLALLAGISYVEPELFDEVILKLKNEPNSCKELHQIDK